MPQKRTFRSGPMMSGMVWPRAAASWALVGVGIGVRVTVVGDYILLWILFISTVSIDIGLALGWCFPPDPLKGEGRIGRYRFWVGFGLLRWMQVLGLG